MSDQRNVEFIKLIPHGRPPKRADRSGAGYLPSRAMRYCDSLTSATGFGYWLFPPMDLSLLWDGHRVFWRAEDEDDWLDLSETQSGSIQFPDFSDEFDKLSPEAFCGYSPPFLTALPELGGVQIWTGLLAKTRPGWSLAVRAPVNLPNIASLTCWEGLVETDLWFGPLFNNFRITQTNAVVRLRASVPFLQVQPIPQISYRDETLTDFEVRGPETMSEAEWTDLGKVLLPDEDHEDRQGLYAVTVRKRRLCPMTQPTLPGPAKGK